MKLCAFHSPLFGSLEMALNPPCSSPNMMSIPVEEISCGSFQGLRMLPSIWLQGNCNLHESLPQDLQVMCKKARSWLFGIYIIH